MQLVRSAGEALEQDRAGLAEGLGHRVARSRRRRGEQANGIDEMSQAVAHMDEMTQQNAALAEESAASAAALGQEAHSLNDLLSRFRTAPLRPSGSARAARAA